MNLSPNTLLRNRYLIVRQIGKGGMGAVYEARDERLGHRVALKQMTLDNETLVRAFEREGRMLAQLDHPALPHVSDFFSSENSHFLVMKYIPGDDLQGLLRKQGQPFAVDKVVEWMDQLLDVLDYLHSHSPPIIHRDIKPANLKLSSQGKIILLDFGISKGGNLDLTRLTQSDHSLFAYTLRYAPLEQINAEGTDERSDLYSLAATFYHLLTAKELPTAMTRAGAQIQYTPDPLLPANQINPRVPVPLANLLSQAMALNPNERPQNAKAMRWALKQAMSPMGHQFDYIHQSGLNHSHSFEASINVMPAKLTPPNTYNPSPVNPPTQSAPDGIKPLRILMVLGLTVLSVMLLLLVVSHFLSSSERGQDTNQGEQAAVNATLTEIALGEVTATEILVPALDPTSTETPTVEPTSTETPTVEPTSTETPTAEPTSTETPVVTATLLAPDGNEELVAPRISEKDGMKLLYVPAGEFLMGSTEDDPLAPDDQKPQRSIYLDAFWIDETEVTNAMFARFVEETGHETYSEKERNSYVYVGEGKWEKIDGANWREPRGPECSCEPEELETHPVVQVTWDDARLYCEWAGRRLPTEAEWEKAARGTDGRLYPWGDQALAGNLLNVCDGSCPLEWADNSYDDRYEFTAPVGSYSLGASPYGALDMMGNVWEWVADWYDQDYYKEMEDRNPPGPPSRQERVLRGASWSNGADWVSSSFRHRDPPTDPNDERGFRCASSP